MTKETMETLNTLQLIGFAAKRGKAWHYRKEDQGTEPNHYDNAIPVEDVVRRLFNFTVSSRPLFIMDSTGTQAIQIPDRQAMTADDNNDVLGIFKLGYQGHSYKEWLLDNVSKLVNCNTGIGSAGLLRNRGVAYVQIEMPESIKTKEGVEFRPNLLATTSYDGTTATTYKRTKTVVVCDNTREAALGESGQAYKLKHTRFSTMKLGDAKAALQMLEETAAEFAEEVETLCNWQVTDAQFSDFLKKLVPIDSDTTKRALTLAETKKTDLIDMYRIDERAAPWQGTAYGVLQAVNTYNHHVATQRGADSRAIRNMENVVSGKFAEADRDVLKMLELVCA